MKVELKRLQHFHRMSDETNAFAADLYVNGKKVGYVKDDGRGGCIDIDALNDDAARKAVRDAEAWAKTLPPVEVPGFNGEPLNMDLELFISELVNADLKAKEEKKLEKKLSQSLAWGVPGGLSYSHVKMKVPIAELLKTPEGRSALIKSMRRWKAEFKPNEVWLNKNIPEDVMAFVNF